MRVEDLSPEVWAVAGHLLEPLRGKDIPQPKGWHILVLQYVRPDKVGSILLANATKREDELQGRVGLVLALGPGAYRDTDRYPEGPWCKVGDWIMWPPLESAATRFVFHKANLALLAEDRIICTVEDPRAVIGS